MIQVREKDLVQQFGIVIRDLRLSKGLSQEDFAERCGLHRTYIGSIERGEKAVTVVTAQKLAKALDCSLSELFIRLEAGLKPA